MLRRAAFSLIELLVVIAIIGVLLALLLPALSGAMERARQTRRLANSQQATVAMAAYAGDFKTHFPAVAVPAGLSLISNQHRYGGLAGFFSLNQQGDGTNVGFTGGAYSNGWQLPLMHGYLAGFASLVCPSDREDRYYGMPYGPGGNTSYAAARAVRPTPAGTEDQVVSYSISYLYFTGQHAARDGHVLLWADETNGPDVDDLAWYGPGQSSPNSAAAGAVSAGRYAPGDNHGTRGGNFSYSDGSGRWHKNDGRFPPGNAPTSVD